MMKYQLVIQFSEELYGDLDWIADLEDRLDESIIDAEVDGHDMGSGEVNIFIHTNNYIDTFKRAKTILEEDEIELKNVKIAYKEINSDNYTSLWPESLVDFKIL